MGLFKSKEQREREQQRQRERDQLQRRLSQLKADVKIEQRAFQTARETHQQSLAPKWEYMEVSSKDRKKWGSLDLMGSMGWELVSAATYEEGYGSMTVFTLYVFKRPIQDLTADLVGKLSEIAELNQEIAHLEKELQ